MTTEEKVDEASNVESQNSNGHAPTPVASASISTEPDPAPGRKMSREEAMDYVFKKNEGLLRRLA